MRPPEIAETSSSDIVPIETSCAGSFQWWLKSFVRAYFPARSAAVIPSRLLMASSLIGGCVPSATITSKAVAPAAPISSCRTRNIRSMGAVRVWSGTIARTRLPRRPHPAISLAQSRRTVSSSSFDPFCPVPVTASNPGVGREPAVDGDHRPGHELRSGRQQPEQRARQILRCPEATRRRVLDDLLATHGERAGLLLGEQE